MCVNAATSITSFIAGTLVNGYVLNSKPKSDYFILAVIYEFIIIMQLFDYMAWKDQKCGFLNQFATKGAFIQNMLQPIVVMLILLFFTKNKSRISAGIVNGLLVVYISYIFYQLYYEKTPKAVTCLKPSEKCKHLQYDWWRNIGVYPIFIFLIPIVASLLLLLNSYKFAMAHSLYLVLAFVISGLFYACGVPSMFCLFAVGGPFLNLLLMKYDI
jgi:hypothetical protein